nr:RNA methyltransferase [Hufsiella ginkgonis]
MPLVLVLDSVRSMHNVGSVFRTADGFAVEKILLCGITGQPPHREIEKTALGATQSIAWAYFEKVEDALASLIADGYTVVAVEQAESSIPLNAYQPAANGRYALIFGNEVNGVSNEAMALAAGCIEIPQFGTKHSFNIVVSAGIVLWDFYTKLTQQANG